MEKKIHQGKNIARFRQILGMKQDLLASIMGDDWTQIKISRLEAKEEIEPGILDDVARALKIPVDAIKNFDEEAAINIVANTRPRGQATIPRAFGSLAASMAGRTRMTAA